MSAVREQDLSPSYFFFVGQRLRKGFDGSLERLYLYSPSSSFPLAPLTASMSLSEPVGRRLFVNIHAPAGCFSYGFHGRALT